MLAEQIVATELARSFYGNRLWGDMSARQKARASEDCLPDARELQANDPISFTTILRLRLDADARVACE
ncbi:MAG: hypothetical protein H8D74_00285 [Chloroflexi bacterium]|nr:hypothetical protein [Chloroflexota bacterium]